jgi:hypothetical protein
MKAHPGQATTVDVTGICGRSCGAPSAVGRNSCKYKSTDNRPCSLCRLTLLNFRHTVIDVRLVPIAMIFSLLLAAVLLLANHVASLVHEKRQFPGRFNAKQSKALDVRDVKPRIRQNARRQLIRYGPFTVPAMTNVSKSAERFHKAMLKICQENEELIHGIRCVS